MSSIDNRLPRYYYSSKFVYCCNHVSGYVMKKKICLVVFGVALLLLAVYFLAARKPAVLYQTVKIKKGKIVSLCRATGTVNPLTTVLVGTQVSGRIKAIYVDYNSEVKEGDLIAEIDPATFEAQLEQARANLISARAAKEQAQATLAEAKRNLERIRKLYDDGVAGKSEFDTAETNYLVSKSQVGVAQAQVIQTEAAFAFAETNLKYTKIHSPVDGIVISRNVDIGQTVAASFQTPTLFTIAEDLKKMQINTNVDEADIGRVEKGMTAEFIVDAYPSRPFSGKVVQVRNSPNIVQNVVTYDVVIHVENPELKLKPGMTASVSIIVAVKDDVVQVPNAALRFHPDAYEAAAAVYEKPGVFVLENGHLRRIEIVPGIDDYVNTELLAGGLQVGQEVLVGYENNSR